MTVVGGLASRVGKFLGGDAAGTDDDVRRLRLAATWLGASLTQGCTFSLASTCKAAISRPCAPCTRRPMPPFPGASLLKPCQPCLAQWIRKNNWNKCEADFNRWQTRRRILS